MSLTEWKKWEADGTRAARTRAAADEEEEQCREKERRRWGVIHRGYAGGAVMFTGCDFC